MKIVDKKTVLINNGNTLTDQHLGMYFGKSVKKFGVYASMRPDLSLTAITDALGNVYEKSSSKKDGFTPINSMAFEWEIDSNYIEKVYFTDPATITGGNGANQEVFTVYLNQKYYNMNDTFALDNRQLLFVVAPPKMVVADKWAFKVRLVADSLSTTVVPAYLAGGMGTIYRSNHYPELSERGYTKFVENTETHRQYLTRHRYSIDWSQQYAANGHVYFETEENKKKVYYKALKKEKEVLDQFLLGRENSMLFEHSNHDIHGKCLLQDLETQQDIPIGDGLIPQVEKYASLTVYSSMTSSILDTALEGLQDKSQKLTGNTYVIMCNKKMYNDFGRAMKQDDRLTKSNSEFLYSKEHGNVQIGATFDAYEFQGNKLIFTPNKALTQEYPSNGYGIILDLSADITTGKPALASFTLEGGEILTGTMEGLGGADGKTSGKISSGISGSQYHLMGYSGIGLFNPYKAHIMKEN